MSRNKVIIEITDKGYITTVFFNGKEYIEEWESRLTGSKCIRGNFENEDDIPEELYYALSDHDPYDIMKQLRINE